MILVIFTNLVKSHGAVGICMFHVKIIKLKAVAV